MSSSAPHGSSAIDLRPTRADIHPIAWRRRPGWPTAISPRTWSTGPSRRTTSNRCWNSIATATARTAFDKIISATHDHFWDPLDKKYIDFDEPFDLENVAMAPDHHVFALRVPYVSDFLADPKVRIAFINHMQLWGFSSILHGEQGALNLSASLCHVL